MHQAAVLDGSALDADVRPSGQKKQAEVGVDVNAPTNTGRAGLGARSVDFFLDTQRTSKRWFWQKMVALPVGPPHFRCTGGIL